MSNDTLPDIPYTPDPADSELRTLIPPSVPGEDTLAEGAPDLPAGPFIGRESFRQLLRQSFAAAAERGWRELLISDPDFTDWPLGEPAVAESLHEWAQKTTGRCIVLARSYEAVPRLHALFVRWRSQWQHKIECFEYPADAAQGGHGRGREAHRANAFAASAAIDRECGPRRRGIHVAKIRREPG